MSQSPQTEDRQAAWDRAAAVLRAGGLVVLPTDTIYGVAARLDHPGAMAALAKAAVEPLPVDPTWHAPELSVVLATLGELSPVQARVMERLVPGPVRIVRAKPAGGATPTGEGAGRDQVGADQVGEGQIGRDWAVRVPDHAGTRGVLARAGGPVVMVRSGALGLGDGTVLREADIARARSLGIEVVDDGPTRHGGPSTTIRFLPEGGIAVERVGVLDEAGVRRRIERLVVFVCTGNTCRSPMAEALARAELERGGRGPGEVPIRLASAGLAAGEGDPMTREAADTLREMGVAVDPHRSKGLTREVVRRAEAIYAMTKGHVRGILAMEPDAPVIALDPQGQDVADPIGQGAEAYRRTAASLQRMIRARFEELRQRP